MLFATFAPLLSRYDLSMNLAGGKNGMIALTIIPRRPDGNGKDADIGAADLQPILLEGTAAEIDAALALGDSGPLGQLIKARLSLGEQIADAKAATEAAEAASKAAAAEKKKATTSKPTPSPAAPKPAASATQEDSTASLLADANPQDPGSLW